jgi:hypothetical protein
LAARLLSMVVQQNWEGRQARPSQYVARVWS